MAEGSCPRLELRGNGPHLCNFLNTTTWKQHRVSTQSSSGVSTPIYQEMLSLENMSAVAREFLIASTVSCCKDTRDESTLLSSLPPEASPSSPLLIGQEAFILLLVTDIYSGVVLGQALVRELKSTLGMGFSKPVPQDTSEDSKGTADIYCLLEKQQTQSIRRQQA